jgi:hypothetical protein
MAPKNINHWVKDRGMKNAEWVVKMDDIGRPDATPGWRGNLVRIQIRAYGLPKGMDDKKGIEDTQLIEFIKYLAQMII